MNVRLDTEARAEVRAAARWYEQQQEGLGSRFLLAVEEALGRVKRLGARASRVAGVGADLGVRRVRIKRFPYMVICLEVSSVLRVVAVAHEHRRPGYWLRRL